MKLPKPSPHSRGDDEQLYEEMFKCRLIENKTIQDNILGSICMRYGMKRHVADEMLTMLRVHEAEMFHEQFKDPKGRRVWTDHENQTHLTALKLIEETTKTAIAYIDESIHQDYSRGSSSGGLATELEKAKEMLTEVLRRIPAEVTSTH